MFFSPQKTFTFTFTMEEPLRMRFFERDKFFFRPSLITLNLLAAFIFLFSALKPSDALALPHFARRIGRNCTFCHTVFPKLNETGRIFKTNGLRFEGEGEWLGVRDLKRLPLSVEAELEGSYDRVTSSGAKTESSDVKIEEVEIFAGGPMGKKGRVTAFTVLAVTQTDTGGAADYDVRIAKAFIQINDIIGPTGAGELNLKAGQDTLALPFMGGSQKFIQKRPFAESVLGVFNPEERLVEINGLIADEGRRAAAHRYRFGVSREDVNDGNKLRGLYAAYSVAINEAYSLGVIYRSGEEKNSATDVSYNRYGIAGEIELKRLIIDAGWFKDLRSGLADRDNFIVEAAYFPAPRLSLATRFESTGENGRDGAKSLDFMVRYNILSNVFAMVEYRNLSDDGHVTGVNEDESKVRLFVGAVF